MKIEAICATCTSVILYVHPLTLHLFLSPVSSILIRYGVSNWMGITDEKEMNYVLPNNGNMGCDLYTDRDMYTVGNTTINGCNDRTVGIKLSMFLNEPR